MLFKPLSEPAAARPARPRPRGFLGVTGTPLLYVNMPKSGCTTLKNILHRLESGVFLEEPLTIHARSDLFVHWRQQPDEIRRRFRTDLVFTFVRHPLRRAYSCFNEKIHFTSPYSFGKVRAHLAEAYGAVFEPDPSLERHRENFKAFLRFARDTCEGRSDFRRDPHWSPQTLTLRAAERWRRIDFIGRTERFDAHLGAVLALAGADRDFEVPRMNEGPPPPHPHDAILDGEIHEIARSFFADDLRNFGYEL